MSCFCRIVGAGALDTTAVSALVELGTLSKSARDLALLLVPVVGAFELLTRQDLLEATVLWNEPGCGGLER